MIRVLVESPFAGNVERNLRYVRMAMQDCLQRGEAPFASHALYTQEGVLDDDVPEQRKLGIDAGLLWGAVAEKTVLYVDLGLSSGMIYGIKNAVKAKRPIEIRTLSRWWSSNPDPTGLASLTSIMALVRATIDQETVQ